LTWQYRWRCLRVFALQIALLALGLLGLSFTGTAIDVVRHSLDRTVPPATMPFGMAPPGGWSAASLIAALGASVLVMATVRAAFNYLYAIGVARLVQMDVVPTLRAQVFDKLQRLSFRFFDEHASGGIINRVTGDVQSLRSFIDGVLMQGGIMALSLVVYVTFMVGKHAGLALATLAATPLFWWATARFSRRVQPAYAASRADVDRLVLEFTETIDGIQTTKVFAREADRQRRFDAKNSAVYSGQLAIFRDVSRFGALIDGLGQVNVVVLLLYGGSLVGSSALTLGDLVVFAGLLQQYSAQVSRAAGIVNTLQQSLAGARRVYEVLDAPVEVASPSSSPARDFSAGRVRFEKVTFGYAHDLHVLRGIDLDVAAGECVAVLGETGSGKSTLLSLVPRFYDPVSGRVLIDGVDVRQLDLDSMRRRMGVVFQSNVLFRDTVASNIAFGHPGATAEQVSRAAHLAKANEFIVALPDGYGARLEARGTNLSGGQRQRIALARALVLEPRILLLDDPTSGIDAQTERELLDALRGAVRGRTTLIATHRVSLARLADRVVVMRRGEIVEQGGHAELLARGGVYARMAELQGIVEAGDVGTSP
jgi:ATP-binding cassette subfamily B protein